MIEDGPDGLLAGLLPAGVALAESFGEAPDADLYPQEAAAVATAAQARRREFAAVRGCARTALEALGVPPVAVPPELDAPEPWGRRAPVWPPGITGSMTHCAGYRAAVAARQEVVLAVGVDAEPHDRLPAAVLDRVSLAEEREMLAALAERRGDVAWDRVLFSAKESVFKAWYPLTRAWLGFEECRVDITPDGALRAVLQVPGPQVGGVRLDAFRGRWRARSTHLATVITVPGGSA